MSYRGELALYGDFDLDEYNKEYPCDCVVLLNNGMNSLLNKV